MSNSKFMRWDVILLGLVVLRTKAQNGFCSMCTKGCHTVLTRSNPFWGQFWGQIGETDSYPHRSNKCAAFVSLRKADTSITEFPRRKSPTNQYINFTLWQEVVRKPTLHHPRTPPLSPREMPLFERIHSVSARCPPSQIPPQNPRFPGIFLFYCKGIYLNGIFLYR